MVAEHSIMVQSGRGIQYKFDIHRKYTIIRGDSATGKTTLVRMIEDAVIRKTADISCDVPCVVLPDINWEINMEAFSESIVFIDEDHPALTTGKKWQRKCLYLIIVLLLFRGTKCRGFRIVIKKFMK